VTIAVIGAGLAGTVAAARLASRGAPVVVFDDRPGATSLHGGGWYLGVQRLSALLEGAAAAFGDAIELVCGGLPELELVDGPFALTDEEGVRRVVDLAPAVHAAAAALPAGFAVADLAPLAHPFAAMQPRGEALTVEFPTWPGAFGRSFAAVAARLDAAPDEADALVAALRRAVEAERPTGLLLPPVLGLRRTAELRRNLEETLGIPVAEALGTLPSTPGLRLAGALGRWLERLNVPVRRARVRRVDAAAGRVETADGVTNVGGVVLATGGVIPGGLVGGESLSEPLAALDLAPPLPVDLLDAVHPQRPYGGRLFRAGVAVDGRCRPVGRDGEPLHARLYAAGDLVGGTERIAEGCASGLALLSGFLAAEHLLGSGGAA
jgi:glycerol-3-phosphate dehydrogenase subunit B